MDRGILEAILSGGAQPCGDPDCEACGQQQSATNAKDGRFDQSTATQLLKDAFAKLNERHEFKPGAIVRQKKGLESGNRDHIGGVAVFVRYGTPPVPETYEHGDPVVWYEIDCVIGHLTPDGGMIEHYGNSSYFEPVEG